MGDRTWATLRFRTDDTHKFKDINEFGDFDIDPSETIQDIDLEEVNYGGQSGVEELAYRNATFTFEHGTGGGYGAYKYVCFFGEIAELPVHQDKGVVAEIDEHGEILEPDDIKRYIKIQNAVHGYLERSDNPEILRLIFLKQAKPDTALF
jgi:hypothetical protein